MAAMTKAITPLAPATTLEELGEAPVPIEEGMEAGGHARLQAAWDTHSGLMDITGKVNVPLYPRPQAERERKRERGELSLEQLRETH
jgi:hypothetical protein